VIKNVTVLSTVNHMSATDNSPAMQLSQTHTSSLKHKKQ